MKLKNKKTGEVWETPKMREVVVCQEDDIAFYARLGADVRLFGYKSLAELNEEWEDYKPKEPLIKDEKIRKAVRAWAEANNINSRHYHETDVKFNSLEHELTWIDTSIQFNEFEALEGLEDGKRYTIDELCGEEEE